MLLLQSQGLAMESAYPWGPAPPLFSSSDSAARPACSDDHDAQDRSACTARDLRQRNVRGTYPFTPCSNATDGINNHFTSSWGASCQQLPTLASPMHLAGHMLQSQQANPGHPLPPHHQQCLKPDPPVLPPPNGTCPLSHLAGLLEAPCGAVPGAACDFPLWDSPFWDALDGGLPRLSELGGKPEPPHPRRLSAPRLPHYGSGASISSAGSSGGVYEAVAGGCVDWQLQGSSVSAAPARTSGHMPPPAGPALPVRLPGSGIGPFAPRCVNLAPEDTPVGDCSGDSSRTGQGPLPVGGGSGWLGVGGARHGLPGQLPMAAAGAGVGLGLPSGEWGAGWEAVTAAPVAAAKPGLQPRSAMESSTPAPPPPGPELEPAPRKSKVLRLDAADAASAESHSLPQVARTTPDLPLAGGGSCEKPGLCQEPLPIAGSTASPALPQPAPVRELRGKQAGLEAEGGGGKLEKVQRMRWTGELHEEFLDRVEQLGGMWTATPMLILRLMPTRRPALTLDHVKSHLQKHRLALRLEGLPGEPRRPKRKPLVAPDDDAPQTATDLALLQRAQDAAASRSPSPPPSPRPLAPALATHCLDPVGAEAMDAAPGMQMPPPPPALWSAHADVSITLSHCLPKQQLNPHPTAFASAAGGMPPWPAAGARVPGRPALYAGGADLDTLTSWPWQLGPQHPWGHAGGQGGRADGSWPEAGVAGAAGCSPLRSLALPQALLLQEQQLRAELEQKQRTTHGLQQLLLEHRSRCVDGFIASSHAAAPFHPPGWGQGPLPLHGWQPGASEGAAALGDRWASPALFNPARCGPGSGSPAPCHPEPIPSPVGWAEVDEVRALMWA